MKHWKREYFRMRYRAPITELNNKPHSARCRKHRARYSSPIRRIADLRSVDSRSGHYLQQLELIALTFQSS
jgi:hypothetical protein